MNLWTRLLLKLGLRYQCECGAVFHPRYRDHHRKVHDSLREWMRPPTVDEFRSALAEGRDHP